MEEPGAGGIDILHVEDDQAFADLCATFLKRLNDAFNIQSVTDPSDAMAVVEENHVDCIVSDYNMPGTSGIEFLKEVRERDIDIPFILFTGKGSEEIASEAISAGVTDYLQKNGHTEQYAILTNRIKNAVESYRREQAAQRYYNQLEAITNHSRDVILTMDANSWIQFANPAAKKVFGYTPEELRGERLTKLMPERLRDRHLRGISRYLRTGERAVDWSNVEFQGLHKDGHEIPLLISYAEYVQADERRFLGIMRRRFEGTR